MALRRVLRILTIAAAVSGAAAHGHDNHETPQLAPGGLRVIDLPGYTDPSGVPLTAEINRLLAADPEFAGEGIDLGLLRFVGKRRGFATMLLGDDRHISTALASGRANKLVNALLDSGDVIALDRRGVGSSANQAPCPRAVEYALDRPLEPSPFAKALRRWLDLCRNHRAETGAQLEQFALPYAVRDVDRVRAVLGIERILVIGYGSGAEIAWGAAAAHPDHIVGVVELRVTAPNPVPASLVPAQLDLAAGLRLSVGSGDLSLATESDVALEAIEARDWIALGAALVEIRSRLARPNPAELAFRATLPATYDDFVSDVSRRALKVRATARPASAVAVLDIEDADVETPAVVERVSAFAANVAGPPDTPQMPE